MQCDNEARPDVLSLLGMFSDYQIHRRNFSPLTAKVRHAAIHRTWQMLGTSPVDWTTEQIEWALDQLPLGPSTRRDYTLHLRAFFRFLLREGIVESNPAIDIETPKQPQRLPRPVREDDLAKVLAHVGDRRPLRTWFLLGAYCGLRRSEIAFLTWDQVDLDAQHLRIIGKGDKERIIPLHPIVARELHHLYWPPNSIGRLWRVSPHHVGFMVTRALRECGIEATCHKLRHRFGTRVYQQTNDLLVTASLLGHAKLDTTMGYAKVADGKMRRAVDSI